MSVLRSPSYEHYNAEAGPSSYTQRQLPQVYSSWQDVAQATHPQHPHPLARSSSSPSINSATSSQSSLSSVRSSRPLPPIPIPSPPTTPNSPSERVASHPRPLPTPPPRINLKTPSTSPSASTSITFRPLPKPVISKIDTTHLHPSRPTLSLLINTPGMSTTEIMFESPIPPSPMSPVIFSKPDSPLHTEESVARRLSTLGFREVDEDAFSRTTLDPLFEGKSYSPRASPTSGTSPCENFRESIEIRVELRSALPEKRASRLWVFEKKGKRWIERNYDEILQQLRKL